MSITTIDHIPPSSEIAAYIDDIAVIDSLDDIKGMKLPAKIDFILSILCEDGSLSIDYDSTSRQLTGRMLMILKPGHVLRSYKASENFKGHFIVVSTKFFGDSISTFSKMLPCFTLFRDNPVITLSAEDAASQIELRALLRRKAYSAGHQYRDKVIRSVIEAMFYETLGLYSSYHSIDAAAMTRRRDALFYKFLQEVEANCTKERSVAYYAGKLCVSPKHLSATVKDASGRTAGEWIDSYVILEAKLLLQNTGLTIQEVSTKLNFPNQSFFGKYFKHLTGMSPRAFRAGASAT
ncbi:AraC family transcriptional regulator [Barnesiella sp. WM24]|uniref:helix-turn-helix domain-containing protein n=1 Tax=Barnesiella sp. WM24 TaxID=2558278 RepID=UPI000B12E9E0|nr:helix-turn-helix domain-containing protein [Barnesiella sp. WM24]TFU92804.1 AraC family transcriptional regulator [Barnesiella sp. WM24]